MVVQRSQIVLTGGMLLALVGGMVLGLATGLLEGPREAHAQPSPGHAFFQLCKQWESSGDQDPPRTFSFSVSDTEQAPVPVAIENVTEGGPPVCVTISALAGQVNISETIAGGFNTPEFASDTGERQTGSFVSIMLSPISSCLFASSIPLIGNTESLVTVVQDGATSCRITFYNQQTGPDPVFRLCKEWRPQGAIAAPRDFTFNVGDSSPNSLVQVTIPDVAEDGERRCILLSASAGPIAITETGIDGFDVPLIYFGGEPLGPGFTIEFGLLSTVCGITTQSLVRQTDALVQPGSGEANCTITFINEDNDVPTVTRTPTPTIVVCAICNRTTTPPPATATATSPPATATNTSPPGTQPPATATPTTGVATQAPGLTDAQRTATAVAAARTAAAQTTPIAPRTGDAGAGGAGGTLNIALLAAGLIVLSSGLGLVAMRGKRR